MTLAAAAELPGELSHVDLGAPAPADDLDLVVHCDGRDHRVEPFHVGQLVHHVGEVAVVAVVRARGQQDLAAFEVVGLARMEQLVEQRDLIGIQMAPQRVGHDVEVRARAQDVGGRLQVPRRG